MKAVVHSDSVWEGYTVGAREWLASRSGTGERPRLPRGDRGRSG
jgi:hypothetical protein